MGRHSADPGRQGPADGGGPPAGTLGPVTDPMLLDAVERELVRMRTTGSLRVAPMPAPAARVARPEVVDEVAGAAMPRRAPFGTRIPMVFGDDAVEQAEAVPLDAVVQFTGEQRLLAVVEDASALDARSPAAAVRPVVAGPVTAASAPRDEPRPAVAPTGPITPPNTMRVGAADLSEPDGTGTSLVFWIVVGTAVIAVLTVVALLPF